MTISQAIFRLNQVAIKSKFGYETCLAICVPDIEYLPVETIELEEDASGALVTIQSPAEPRRIKP